MKEYTGATNPLGKFDQGLYLSVSKMGKSCFTIAQALGVFPGQMHGGIVDKPENLHVVTFDQAALDGVNRFLLETCGAPKDVLAYRVYNMQQDLQNILRSEDAHDRDFYNGVIATIRLITQRVRGTSFVLFSSVTAMAEGILRGISGPISEKKSDMDQNKWSALAQQMTEIRNWAHGIPAHIAWEGHIYKKPPKNGQEEGDETLHIPGQTATNMPMNMAHIYRLRRANGQFAPGSTTCIKTYIDTKASGDFMMNGRNFTEALEKQETDLTEVFDKLGLQVGGWKPSVTPKPANNVRAQVRKES